MTAVLERRSWGPLLTRGSGADLILVAHGSRDPRSADHIRRLTDRVRRLAPAMTVQAAFLELSSPSLEEVLEDVYLRGGRQIVLVPLLLGSAYHAKVDLPSRLAAAEARLPGLSAEMTNVLGGDDALLQTMEGRGRELPGCDGYVVMATGSSNHQANATVQHTAAALAARTGRPVEAGFVTAAPCIGHAVTHLEHRDVTCVGVLPWFLAPGLLLDKGAAAAVAAVSEAGLAFGGVARPLADDDGVARLVLHRVASAIAVT